MVSLARVMSSDPSEVEDIVMDAFLETGKRFERLTNPGGYLRTSVINGARRCYRNSVNRNMILTRFAGSVLEPDEPEVGEHYLADILGTLPEAQHTTLVLLYYIGMTHSEAAEVMNCPVGTVKSNAHRALKNLRQKVPT